MSESSAIHLFPGGSRPERQPRSLPHSEEAEQALLGSILVDNRVLDRVSDYLRPEHFFYPAHARIFDACLKLREQGRVADTVTLRARFEQDGDLAQVGGGGYLTDLAASVLSLSSAGDYARMLFDLHLRRQLVTLGDEVAAEAVRPDAEADGMGQIESTEERLYQLASTGTIGGDFKPFDIILDGALEAANRALNRETRLTGVTTGLADLDRMLGGLQASDLLILAGRPSMGKTALATNIAFNAAKAAQRTAGREGAVVGFFSLEMSAEQLAVRILSEEAEIPSEDIRKGSLKRTDFPRLVEAAQTIRRVPLFVDDTAGLTIGQLRTRALRMKRRHDLGLVVVDYLQLMRPSGSQRTDNRVQEISEITRGLKMVAKDLNLPVIALSQLSRAVEQREDKRPQLADLRESGSIEQDADVVMFVFREEYYVSKREPTLDTPEHATWMQEMDRVHNLAEVIVGKQRHGPTGTVRLHFEGRFTRFSDYEGRFDGPDL